MDIKVTNTGKQQTQIQTILLVLLISFIQKIIVISWQTVFLNLNEMNFYSHGIEKDNCKALSV